MLGSGRFGRLDVRNRAANRRGRGVVVVGRAVEDARDRDVAPHVGGVAQHHVALRDRVGHRRVVEVEHDRRDPHHRVARVETREEERDEDRQHQFRPEDRVQPNARDWLMRAGLVDRVVEVVERVR